MKRKMFTFYHLSRRPLCTNLLYPKEIKPNKIKKYITHNKLDLVQAEGKCKLKPFSKTCYLRPHDFELTFFSWWLAACIDAMQEEVCTSTVVLGNDSFVFGNKEAFYNYTVV